MSTTPFSKNRLLTSLGQLCNGTLTETGMRQLEEWLNTHQQARTIYANYMAMHAELYSEPSIALQPTTPTTLEPSRSESRSTRRWSWALAAAITLCVLSLGPWILRHAPGEDDTSLASDHATTDPEASFVAQVTGTHNCLWKESADMVGYGEKLTEGRCLELAEGLAEITFNDGATILLEGPASFAVTGPAAAKLHAGRMAAVVPSRATAFRVSTNSVDLLEAGTEFGLHAQASGASEIHIFHGTAKADVLDPNGLPRERLQLSATEAVRINPVSTTIVELVADDAKFIRTLAPSAGPRDGLLAYEGFTYPAGPLTAQNGGFGWAGPWFSIAADKSQGRDSNSVAKGSLAVQGMVPLGNRAAIIGHENRIRRSLATSVGGVFDAAGLVENQDGVRLVGRDSKTVYLSFLQRVSRVGDEFYGLELHRGDGNANRVLCLGHGDNDAGYSATSNVSIYRKENAPSLGQEDTTAHLFVVKISYGSENRDILEVYRDPPLAKVGTLGQPVAKLRGNFSFDRVSLANFHGDKIHEVDELRIGESYFAVTKRWGGTRGRLIRSMTTRSLQTPAQRRVGEPWPHMLATY